VRTFIYKRTHKGDPDKKGRFGINDCMGRDRNFDFDAVIGVGGVGIQAKAAGIDRKVNWIGVGSRKEPPHGRRGSLVTFDHFVLFEEKGKKFRAIAPILARRMYSTNGPRFLFNDDLTEVEQREIDRLLAMAKTKPPSAGTPRPQSHARSSRCDSGRC
jgi:hypothetical protein